ncbi:hypothetical protein [Helicobacter sp. T3_23-1059]
MDCHESRLFNKSLDSRNDGILRFLTKPQYDKCLLDFEILRFA